MIKPIRKPANSWTSGSGETLADPPTGPVLVKPAMVHCLVLSAHTQAQRGSHKLWIADNSKPVAQGQSQGTSDVSLRESPCRCSQYTETNTEAAEMGRQRNRPQMKEQENSQEELDEMEASN